MNYLTLSVNFLIFSLILVYFPAQAKDKCNPGNPKNTAYLLRENDRRCEGITTPDVSNDFTLASFAIGQLQPTEKLTLIIPKISTLSEPTVRVQSTLKYYQLDPLKLNAQGNQWQFQWNNEVLFKENIPPSTLRTIAIAKNVVIPVRLSPAKPPAYDIRIHTGNRAKTITLKIQQNNGNELYSKTLTNQPGSEVKFSWDGKTNQGKIVPAGRYTLAVNAQIERKNDADSDRSLTQQFEHNPSWLK